MRLLLIYFVALILVMACQRIILINESPGDHELEAPSPVHVDLERNEENTNTE